MAGKSKSKVAAGKRAQIFTQSDEEMNKIKIAIIAHNCRAGGGLFGTLNLLKSFKNASQNEELLLVCSSGYGFEEIELPINSELFIYKGGHSPFERLWFETITLPKIIQRYNPDVIFGMGNTGLAKPRVPQTILIHQAYLFYDKKRYSDIPHRLQLRIALMRFQIRKSLAATNLIFVQTPIVKERFSDTFNYPKGQINVLRWPAPAEIKPTMGLKAPSILGNFSESFFILVLTRYLPHRNPSILIPICKRYGKELRSKRIKFVTTVEPEEDIRSARFLNEIPKHHFEDIIINVGHLSREDVLRYLTYSHALWLPTTLETLCLPFLEAMAMGLPILAPDIDFARYVCGAAALFYNPWDIESIFGKIILIKENATLRQELIEMGKIELGNRGKFAEDWGEVATDMLRDLRSLTERNQCE